MTRNTKPLFNHTYADEAMNTQVMETLKNKLGGIDILQTIADDWLLVVVCQALGLETFSPSAATTLLNENADVES